MKCDHKKLACQRQVLISFIFNVSDAFPEISPLNDTKKTKARLTSSAPTQWHTRPP